jgi:hypothetical protein
VAPLLLPPHKFTQQPGWYSQLQNVEISQNEKVFRGMKLITGFMKISKLVSVLLTFIDETGTMLGGSLVTTAWCALRLQMEEMTSR